MNITACRRPRQRCAPFIDTMRNQRPGPTRLRSLQLIAFLATTLLAVADPIDSATLAAMRLSEAPNYSWSSSVTDDAHSYVKTGKYRRDGYTWATLPMVESI